MSKGILNNRDKMIWDNTHKPNISDVTSEINSEMDDLLDDHDDKIVDIVGDNMNDLLDAHDDKVVSIVGDNMSTLLTGAASTVQLLAGDLSGITTTGVKVGKWDATNDIYAKRFTGTFPESESSISVTLDETNHYELINVVGLIKRSNGVSYTPSPSLSILSPAGALTIFISSTFSAGSYDIVVHYLVSTVTP